MKVTDEIMNMPVNYDGEVVPLGQVWVDLLRMAPSEKCVDRYIQGLLLGENKRDKIRKDRLWNQHQKF